MASKSSIVGLLLLLILFGCGQDNPTSSGVTSPAQKITGTYELSSASGVFLHKDGVLSFDKATSITGTLILGDGKWDQTYVVDGVTYAITDANCTINYTKGPLEGTIQYVYQDGAGGYSFSIDGYNLNLSGISNSKWTKVSDK